MEGQRDERLKTAGLVLQLAQSAKMIDAMMRLFDMAVEHGGVGAQTELVCLAVDAKPSAGVGLVFADFVAYFWMENLRAAAGQTAKSGFLELRQQVASRPARQPREPIPLHRRVR